MTLHGSAYVLCAVTSLLMAQDPAETPDASKPAPVSTPSITGPLEAASPIPIGGDKLPDLFLNGAVSGMGVWQGNHVPGDNPTQAALSNGQVFVQKTTGWWQFYVQAGAYDIPSLGTPFLSTEKTLTELFGPVPVAYLKIAPAKNTAIQVGSLPALVGAESTFTFQNMNVNRGLLWNQENAVNRGIQVNQTMGKMTASLSWNDGFYSNRYSWLSGLLSYSNGPHSLAFSAAGNLSQTSFQTLATPVQNNGTMYAVSYTYSNHGWIFQPYIHHSAVLGASATGGAFLASRKLKRGFSLAARGEYITSSEGAVNLLYGPGSSAWSATVTPTFQYGRFFARGDLSWVRANGITPGYAFGPDGLNQNQPRATIEGGILF